MPTTNRAREDASTGGNTLSPEGERGSSLPSEGVEDSPSFPPDGRSESGTNAPSNEPPSMQGSSSESGTPPTADSFVPPPLSSTPDPDVPPSSLPLNPSSGETANAEDPDEGEKNAASASSLGHDSVKEVVSEGKDGIELGKPSAKQEHEEAQEQMNSSPATAADESTSASAEKDMTSVSVLSLGSHGDSKGSSSDTKSRQVDSIETDKGSAPQVESFTAPPPSNDGTMTEECSSSTALKFTELVSLGESYWSSTPERRFEHKRKIEKTSIAFAFKTIGECSEGAATTEPASK
ncbi:hypothetical protein K488DRAFT_71370 [Vararia minispora EC-137]|uniref:Uncharacterized protein n=1 Tax=Vararia minispora EC-137 TaxID=1314806 RepID=A0ACB8QID6_9AGAM|nr:hypothetical protein K488DRAFT_71370 [Vararia minispora EC-137]